MHDVFIAIRTVLFVFHPIRMQALVLLRRVVAMFAFRALKCDYFTHNSTAGFLLDNFSDNTGTNRVTAFTNSEAQFLFHGDGLYQLNCQVYIITRHNHLGSLR